MSGEQLGQRPFNVLYEIRLDLALLKSVHIHSYHQISGPAKSGHPREGTEAQDGGRQRVRRPECASSNGDLQEGAEEEDHERRQPPGALPQVCSRPGLL